MEPASVSQALMRPPWRFLVSRWPWLSLLYLLLSALIGLALVPVVIFTVLLLPLWGILVGALERRRTGILGFPRKASGHVTITPERRDVWLSVRMSERATWRETAALMVDFLVGWIVLLVLLFEAASLVVLLTIGATANGVPVIDGLADVRLFGNPRVVLDPENWWLVIPIGLATLCAFAYINALLAAGQASVLHVLCGPRQSELARNVERLIRSRAALVEAFETERRRIERDLHDGVQQELVTLAARLGMVSLEVDDLAASGADTESARIALDATQDQAEHAMATLRNTVRGIHPAVLTDYGLSAALHELANRTPVPLSVEVAEFDRLPAPVETAAYYFVTEAISNAAKHSSATRVTVRASVELDRLAVVVTDNGQGGADERVGTGLSGLRERAETLGGSFSIESPDGGPTTLHMTLPTVAEGATHNATAAR